MQFFYLSGNIMKLKSGTFVVCQGVFIPIIDDALFYKAVEIWL